MLITKSWKVQITSNQCHWMFASESQCRSILLHQEISIQLHCSDHVNRQAVDNLWYWQYWKFHKLRILKWISEHGQKKSFLVKFFHWFRVDLFVGSFMILYSRLESQEIIEWMTLLFGNHNNVSVQDPVTEELNSNVECVPYYL